jgi:hypothetical protein
MSTRKTKKKTLKEIIIIIGAYVKYCTVAPLKAGEGAEGDYYPQRSA